nr:energy transducer TonB [uncultured Desulfobulbus sp.]
MSSQPLTDHGLDSQNSGNHQACKRLRGAFETRHRPVPRTPVPNQAAHTAGSIPRDRVGQPRALALSLLIHCTLIAGVLAIAQSLEPTHPPLVIDLSLSVSEARAGEADKAFGSPVAAPLSTPTTPSQPQAVHPAPQSLQQPVPQPVKIARNPVRKSPAKTAQKKHRKKPVSLTKSSRQPAPLPQTAPIPATAQSNPAPSTSTTGRGQAASGASQKHSSLTQAGLSGGNHGTGGGSRYDFNAVRRKILKNLRFPSTARKMGLSGKMVVSFVLKTDGYVEAINVVTSSGHAILDRAVVSTIRRLAPFSKPPVRAQLMLPIVFHLRS